MTVAAVSEVLEQEHRTIDGELAAFRTSLDTGEWKASEFVKAADALRRHIYIEEAMLFPPLREAGFVAPVFVMIREHAEIWDELDTVTHSIAAHDGVEARRACDRLALLLDKHNMKEEQILYPQTDAALAEGVSAEVSVFLNGGELPAGWVCQGRRE